MQLLKIGLVNLNPAVGAIHRNLEKMIQVAGETAEAKCGLVAFTEQVLPGYPTEDLVQWAGFVTAQFRALREFAAATGKFSFPTVFT
ncbi:MAG: NAD(+) synthase, partial [Vicinamibacteria bacterium]